MYSYTLFVVFLRFPSRRSNIGGVPSSHLSLSISIFPIIKLLKKELSIVLPREKSRGYSHFSNTFHKHFLKGEWILVDMRSKHQPQHPLLCLVFVYYKGVCGFWMWELDCEGRKLSTKKLMLLNCGVGEDSWESLGLQGDPTSPS